MLQQQMPFPTLQAAVVPRLPSGCSSKGSLSCAAKQHDSKPHGLQLASVVRTCAGGGTAAASDAASSIAAAAGTAVQLFAERCCSAAACAPGSSPSAAAASNAAQAER